MSSHGLSRSALRLIVLAFALMLLLPAGYAVFTTVYGAHRGPPPLPSKRPLTAGERAVLAVYQARLSNWQRIRGPYEKKAAAYWALVNEKRLARRERRARGISAGLADYVLDQPPVYSGPPRPAKPSFMRKPNSGMPAAVERDAVPVVADFLRTAAEHFKFTPDRPANEIDYKRAYVRTAFAAGIGKEQAVRIYAFEAGGNGRHDVQAGLEYSAKARAITTALGYNQLLATNTIGLLAEHGEEFIGALTKVAETATPDRRKRLQEKIAVLRQMIAFARTFPNQWAEHDKVARTPKGYALHALILDIDTGPLLQTRKLLDSMEFAKKKGISGVLSGAELEMMNLMGDGSGLDVLSLTPEMREKVPTSNFFQRGGYERNPIVSKYNVAAKLIAATSSRMDTLIALPGAKEMEAEFDAAANAAATTAASKTASGTNGGVPGK